MKPVIQKIKRNLFFLFEALSITRSERIAITTLFLLILVVTILTTWIRGGPGYDQHYYAEIEQLFQERSRMAELERAEILARYNPESRLITDSGQDFSGEVIAISDTSVAGSQSRSETGLVNINRANEEELQQLPGIGPAYAARIMEWRKVNGSFSEPSQLLEIRGIGPRRLEQLLPLITLEE